MRFCKHHQNKKRCEDKKRYQPIGFKYFMNFISLLKFYCIWIVENKNPLTHPSNHQIPCLKQITNYNQEQI